MCYFFIFEMFSIIRIKDTIHTINEYDTWITGLDRTDLNIFSCEGTLRYSYLHIFSNYARNY